MQIILAPHIDDELIGCYSVLNDIDEVIYFYDYTNEHHERIAEAESLQKEFGYRVSYSTLDDIVNKDFSNDTIFVPSSKDKHQHHKAINNVSYLLNPKDVKFYSIDMNRKPKLVKGSHHKKELMYKHFPSQINLFNSDEKYFLFEDIHNNDFVLYNTFKYNSVIIELEELEENDHLTVFKNIKHKLKGVIDINIHDIFLALKLTIKENHCIIRYNNKILEIN